MKAIRWRRATIAILGIALLAAAGAAALPDNEYQRFSSLEDTIQKRIRWIYERTHYDPTPIDVAIVGPSRSGAAVIGPRLEADLARLGRPLRAVNFSLAENGRDLHWVVVQELLETKAPRLLVISVIEKPSRFGHPAYKYIAPAADVVDPAYFGNLGYLKNLIYLPYRQLRLFTAQFLPGEFGLAAKFDPARYGGVNNDATAAFRADTVEKAAQIRQLSRAQLDAAVRRYERGVNPPLLGERFADQEFGNERAYVARMADLARRRGVRVAFLFLPYYSGPAEIQERAFYERYGPVIDARFIAAHDDWYSDVAHLNPRGAAILTDWLAPKIAALADAPATRDRR